MNNHKLRSTEENKQFSSNGTITETMTARGMGLNLRKGKEFENSKTGGHEELKKTSMLSTEKNDIERLIVQRSSRRRRSLNQMPTSHRCMAMILIHLVIHFLSPLLIIVQINLSEFWIRVLLIMFVPSESELLILGN